MEHKFQIKGMTCQHCQAAAERALLGVTGVQSAKVDLDSESAWVQGTPTFADLSAAIKAEGFELLTAAK